MGADEEKFVVHKNMICHASAFFKNACSKQWKEAKEGLVRLPDVKPHTFGVYQGWLYTGVLDFSTTPTEDCQKQRGLDLTDDAFNEIAQDMADAYVVGDMLRDSGFCNSVVDELISVAETHARLPGNTVASEIWQKVPPGSAMRRLLVDYFTFDCSEEVVSKAVEIFPADLVKEIAKAGFRDISLSGKDKRPKNRPKCFYHDHTDAAKKCA